MALPDGSRLGPYEIQSRLGAGGMGEVYKARDTRLDRHVAIKILPEALATDPQFRERFDREARVISQLDHPHICALYDVGQHEAPTGSNRPIAYLVMQYLEGQTLESRLNKGALPLGEAMTIATQIADALGAAHRAGITHRDLKPGNVILTRQGAKLLDFGLAKTGTSVAAQTGLSMLPTTPPNLTAQGSILGTFQYMAPEQLEGHEADARADIFAFGSVLYEMVTGRKAFEGKSHASLISAIMSAPPPPLAARQPLAPPALDHVIQKCLAKNPDDRWQDVHDVGIELRWVATAAGSQPAAVGRARREPWIVTTVILLAVSAAALMFALTRVPARQREVTRFTLSAPSDTVTDTAAVVSPDGRRIAFTGQREGRRMLWVRSLNSLSTQPIDGTDGLTNGSIPFWSPDSRVIGFFAQGKLKTVEPGVSPPQIVCDASTPRGGTWNRAGTIVFAPNTTGPLYRVPATGGVPVPATALDTSRNERSHRWPQFLPDGAHFLYLARSATAEQTAVYVGQLESPRTVRLFASEAAVQFAPPDVLILWRAGSLLAQRFDASALAVTGTPVAIADHVDVSTVSSRAYASLSETGVLAYTQVASSETQLTWIERNGALAGTLGPPARYSGVSISPDRTRAALTANDGEGGSHIWMADLARSVTSRFTFGGGREMFPIWSPDSATILFTVQRPDSSGQLYRKASNGSGIAEPLRAGDETAKYPTDWSRDGKFFVFHSFVPDTQSDIWMAPPEGGVPTALVRTRFEEEGARLSPDGRWMAYTSDESNQFEVYVQSFPPGRGKWRISANGGRMPEWRPDGKEIYFVDLEGRLVAAPVNGAASFEAGGPTVLFDLHAPRAEYPTPMAYAPTRDGQRFLVNRLVERDAVTSLVVVLDWTAQLKK